MAIHPAISFKPYVFEIERSERFMGKKVFFWDIKWVAWAFLSLQKRLEASTNTLNPESTKES